MIDTIALYQLADQQGYDVYWYSFRDPRLESVSVSSCGMCAIAVDPFKLVSEADERYKMAHELGHCELGAFYNAHSPCDIREKHECKADRWAIRKLIPKQELWSAINRGLQRWEIAELFCAPEQLVQKAIDYYKLVDIHF